MTGWYTTLIGAIFVGIDTISLRQLTTPDHPMIHLMTTKLKVLDHHGHDLHR
jgi:hypothetical protein